MTSKGLFFKYMREKYEAASLERGAYRTFVLFSVSGPDSAGNQHNAASG